MSIKLKVYKPSEPMPKPPPEVHFKLEDSGDGSVKLVVVDRMTGNPIHRGYVLKVLADGTMFRNVNVSEFLGLDLDTRGRIKDTSLK